MADQDDVERTDEEGHRPEADSAEVPQPPDDEPDSNIFPRQIDDDQDATWFLTP